MSISIKNFKTQVEIKDPQTNGRLTIFPLFDARNFEKKSLFDEEPCECQQLHYLLLEEALDHNSFEIGEVSTSGEVNTVLITNMVGTPVLLLDGEEIFGAKQNRIVNATILVATGKKTMVPVSCVERGRWRYSTDKFSKSDVFGYSTLRRQKAKQVSVSLCTDQSFNADQEAIWEEIDRNHDRMGTHSSTGALHETYRRHEVELEKMVAAFEPLPEQLGLAVYINGRFVCLDLFDQSCTLKKLWPRLLKSYAAEALNTRARPANNLRFEPEDVVEAIAKSEHLTYPSIGLGQDLRLIGQGIIGAGLIIDEQIVHLSVFGEEYSARQDNIGRPYRRRRNLS